MPRRTSGATPRRTSGASLSAANASSAPEDAWVEKPGQPSRALAAVASKKRPASSEKGAAAAPSSSPASPATASVMRKPAKALEKILKAPKLKVKAGAKAKAVPAMKAAKAPVDSRPSGSDKIVFRQDNPKTPSSSAHQRYQKYRKDTEEASWQSLGRSAADDLDQNTQELNRSGCVLEFCPELVGDQPCGDQRRFRHKPSVGTWLLPKLGQRSEPPQEIDLALPTQSSLQDIVLGGPVEGACAHELPPELVDSVSTSVLRSFVARAFSSISLRISASSDKTNALKMLEFSAMGAVWEAL